jgi:Neuraminidase (sialidase)
MATPKKSEKFTFSSFVDKHWRHFAAGVYVTICMFDFVVMPAIIATRKPSVVELERLSHADKLLFEVVTKRYSSWDPLTLANGGIFHISFGTILAGATMLKKGSNAQYNIVLESDSVKSYVRLLIEEELDDEQVRKYVEVVGNYATVEQYVSFSKTGRLDKAHSVARSKKNNAYIYEIITRKDISSEEGKYIVGDLSQFIDRPFELTASYH